MRPSMAVFGAGLVRTVTTTSSAVSASPSGPTEVLSVPPTTVVDPLAPSASAVHVLDRLAAIDSGAVAVIGTAEPPGGNVTVGLAGRSTGRLPEKGDVGEEAVGATFHRRHGGVVAAAGECPIPVSTPAPIAVAATAAAIERFRDAIRDLK